MPSLIEMCSWKNVTGWQGVTCSCGATHNIMVGISDFICEKCSKLNKLSYDHHLKCHKKPDFGWNRSVICWAMSHYSSHRFFHEKVDKLMKKIKR